MLMKPQNWALERGFGLWDLCDRGWDHGSTLGNASHEVMLSSAHTAGTLTCSEHPAQGDSCGLSPDKCCIKRDQFNSADPLQPLMQGLLGLTGAAVQARRCLCWRAGGVQHFQHTCTFPKAKNTTPDFGRSLSDPEAFRMFLLLCFARSSCRCTWAGAQARAQAPSPWVSLPKTLPALQGRQTQSVGHGRLSAGRAS